MNKLFAAIGAILSALYITNPTGGFIELIPDNLPLVGNLDEAGATLILVQCLKVLFSKRKATTLDADTTRVAR